jgi:hypothetical protein
MTGNQAVAGTVTPLNVAVFLGYAHPTATAVAAITLFLSLLWLLTWPSAEPHRRAMGLVRALRVSEPLATDGRSVGECVRCQDGGGRARPPR